MSDHIAQDRIHDLVDGVLTDTERRDVEAHLAQCLSCREAVTATTEVVRELGDLPRMAAPPEDLWGAIEARLAPVQDRSTADASQVQVLPLPTAGNVVGNERARSARRFSFSVPQLAAAAVAVSLLSAGAVWMALGGGAGGGAARGVPGISEPGAARMVSAGESSYLNATAELEAVLAAGRDVLAPETLAAVENSLRTIDQAIAEVEAALREDPSSELLSRMLVNHQGTRLRMLRQAAILVQSHT